MFTARTVAPRALSLVLYLYVIVIFTAQCTLEHMRGLGIACRPSVCPSVTLVDCDHIGGNLGN